MSVYPRSSEVEIFRQDVFWKELLIEKRECNEKMLNLRRKRVAGEREDEVLAIMETVTGNGLSAEDRFQVQTKQGNLLSEV